MHWLSYFNLRIIHLVLPYWNITIPDENLAALIGCWVATYNLWPSTSVPLSIYQLALGTTLGSDWPNNSVTLCSTDEDFVAALCMDEWRGSKFSFRMVRSGNRLELLGY